MMGRTKDNPPLSREEDYRDFDERNLDEGWPYADGSGAGAQRPDNRAYGETSANFDRERNEGFRVDGSDESGSENPLKEPQPHMIDRDEADDLEARVHDNLENIPDVDVSGVDIHAEGHVVTLEGTVETIGEARKIELGALSVDGVHHVRNRMQTTGVDSRIADTDYMFVMVAKCR